MAMIASRTGPLGSRAVLSLSCQPRAIPCLSRYNVAALPLTRPFHERPISIEKISASDENSKIAKQRTKRPVSPHLKIYDPSQIFLGASIWMRITGALFSGGLYAFASAYLVAPLMGWHVDSISLAAAFGELPAAVKGGLKFLVAWPFAFHGINGVRQLVWDSRAKGFGLSTIRQSSLMIWFGSLVLALGAALYL